MPNEATKRIEPVNNVTLIGTLQSSLDVSGRNQKVAVLSVRSNRGTGRRQEFLLRIPNRRIGDMDFKKGDHVMVRGNLTASVSYESGHREQRNEIWVYRIDRSTAIDTNRTQIRGYLIRDPQVTQVYSSEKSPRYKFSYMAFLNIKVDRFGSGPEIDRSDTLTLQVYNDNALKVLGKESEVIRTAPYRRGDYITIDGILRSENNSVTVVGTNLHHEGINHYNTDAVLLFKPIISLDDIDSAAPTEAEFEQEKLRRDRRRISHQTASAATDVMSAVSAISSEVQIIDPEFEEVPNDTDVSKFE